MDLARFASLVEDCVIQNIIPLMYLMILLRNSVQYVHVVHDYGRRSNYKSRDAEIFTVEETEMPTKMSSIGNGKCYTEMRENENQ